MPRSRPLPHTPTAKREESGYYEAYVGFARTLRVWFIAYGIGGPAAFLTNEAAGKKLFTSGSGRTVAYAFLGGVVVQVLLAVLYKSAMWYLYLGEFDDKAKTSTLYRISDWISESYSIELFGDLTTFALFAGATLRLLRIFVT